MAVGSKFEIIEKIGEGGMGEVFKARLFNESGFEKIVAAKRIHELNEHGSLRREASILSKLSHPNICEIYDIKEFSGEFYIIMEYVNGVSLRRLLDFAVEKGFNFSEDFIWTVAEEIISAIEYAHRSGIVHQDISPHNIMISFAGDVKILDFGLAHQEFSNHSKSDTGIYGKVRYCSPEVLSGASYASASDIYSIGIILSELMKGEKPFAGKTEAQVATQILNGGMDISDAKEKGYSKSLVQLIEKLVVFSSENRINASSALVLINTNQGTKGIRNNSLISSELSRLKSFQIERTKTLPLLTQKNVKRKSNKLIYSVISIFFFSVVTVCFYLQKNETPKIVISVINDGKKYAIEPVDASSGQVELGGELGAYLSPSACDYAATSLLAFPSILFADNAEILLKQLNMNQTPNEMLTVVLQYFSQVSSFYGSLKKNCAHNEVFKVSSMMWEDLEKNVSLSVKNEYETFVKLKLDLESKTLFSEQKWNSLLSKQMQQVDNDQMLRLNKQLQSLKEYPTDDVLAFDVLQVPIELFPTTLNECRLLLDHYWVKLGLAQKITARRKENVSILLLAFPLDSSIKKYGHQYIEFVYSGKIDQSPFKKQGVCTYTRVKGEVTEVSLRHLE